MHFCKWCKKRMSGSHRQHRDNPNYKSKMQINMDLSDKKITGHWGGQPIWREKTPEERLEKNGIKPEVANLYIKLNQK